MQPDAGAAPQAAPRHGRHRWFGAAIAASLIAVAATSWVGRDLVGQRKDRIYATGDAMRDIALADGSRIALAPHSRLTVSPGEMRLRIDGGGWFDIRHRPDRSLAIAAGPVEIRDIGTRFDVQAEGDTVRIAVADGNVRVSGAALDRDLSLSRGRRLQYAGGMAELADGDPAAMGNWRDGRLTYDNAPLALVTADLARYARVRVVVAKVLRDRRFSGTLAAADGEQQVRDLAQLMGLALVRDGAGYRLAERPR
ncbi:MAG: FecR domain-containing protein [Sphingomonadales bacterium]|nr:FecR domain-containing protein [Sphingomonadales bacterium]